MRERILEILRKHSGKYVNGQEIAEKLGVSRIAIWKQIQSLKKQGYRIVSQKKMGYNLVSCPDLLLPAEISYGLKTKIMGQKIFYFKDIDSTNDYAKKIASGGAKEGTIVVVEKQTKGKGRLGRSWFSPANKNIYFSIILRPNILPADVPKITLLIGLAVKNAIRNYCDVEIKLKWPNDLVMQVTSHPTTKTTAGRQSQVTSQKKVGGILTETSSEQDRVNFAVVGIGLNVNIHKSEFPGFLKLTASSLKELTLNKKDIDRVVLLQEILKELEIQYQQFLNGKWEKILAEYKKEQILFGKKVKVVYGDNVFQGIVKDIDHNGALILKDKDKTYKIEAGEVSILKKF